MTPRAPFREPHSASQHQAATAWNPVCEHLCFISVYSVQPLARCVLRSLLLPFIAFGLREVSEDVLLSESGGSGCKKAFLGLWTHVAGRLPCPLAACSVEIKTRKLSKPLLFVKYLSKTFLFQTHKPLVI